LLLLRSDLGRGPGRGVQVFEPAIARRLAACKGGDVGPHVCHPPARALQIDLGGQFDIAYSRNVIVGSATHPPAKP